MLNIKEIEAALSPVILKQQQACSIHTLFSYQYPIGIGVSNKLHVFLEQLGTYQYKSTVTLPMQIREGTQAAFYIDELQDCCCVVTPSCLKESNFFATILHEFVHCYQNRTCEDNLKTKLSIYQRAKSTQDYMWEINHPFPYENLSFQKLLQSITRYSLDDTMDVLSILSAKLEIYDYEYMIWQLWKEGFARYIENGILRMNDIEENNGGSNIESPNRTSLYFVGDWIWRQLEARDRNLIEDIEKAFSILKHNYGLTMA